LERTLRRELFEEVGVKVRDKMEYVRNTSFKLDNDSEVIDIVFLCELKEGEPYAKSTDEVNEVYWMTTDEIVKHCKSPEWLIDSVKEAEAILKCRTS
jgi:8-oxo-dGTP diphosphatase